jgi:glutamyl-tRNA reductase
VEVNKFIAKLGRLSPEQREVVDGLVASIINKLLHSPLVALKDEARSKNGALYAEAVRRLFNLDKDLHRRPQPAASDKEDSADPGEDAETKY